MARARNIKFGFYKNEDLAECSVWARLIFPGLWMLADREGRLEDRPKRIKGELLPFDNVEVEPLLVELARWGFIRRYEACGVRVIQISNFLAHQAPHGTEKDSALPDENGCFTVHERSKNGCVTGSNSKTHSQTVQKTVNPPLEHVNPPFDNALNPDSLNPDSLNPDSLNPDSLNPESTHSASALAHDPPDEPSRATKAGAVCVVLKSEGVSRVNPSHPDLIALIGQGAEVGQFSEAAKLAVSKGKPSFAYVLGIVRRQLEDVEKISSNRFARDGPVGPEPETFRQRDDRIARARWEQMTGQTHPDNLPAATPPPALETVEILQ